MKNILPAGLTAVDVDFIAPAGFITSYSITDCGVCNGVGNFYADPIFTNPDNEDYTLQISSLCIDAGDPSSDLDPDGTIADMGAYPFYHIWGCTDSLATNYDSEENTNDGSCYGYPDNGDYSLHRIGL